LKAFSQAYGLAGLRVGYGIAHPAAAKKMRTYLTMGSINEIAVAAAKAAIEDDDALQMSVQGNLNERQEFFNQAISRMLRPVDSHANFVFMNVPSRLRRASGYSRGGQPKLRAIHACNGP
jgi:histidinol-phosphate aminotransferase